MPSFADLSTETGLVELNTFLADKTYLVGFVPSTADVEAFGLVGKAPCANKYPHANRWYVTIASYDAAERQAFVKTEAVTVKAAAEAKKADDDDVDLFGDDDDEEYEKQLEARRKAAEALKKPKDKPIAKSSLLIDVSPWDDTTDMVELEKSVRSVEMEGLLWGASKLVEVAYGIKKLQINAVIVDDLVSTDELESQITGFEDYVQSFNIAAFNKI
eukprot:gene2682-3327_t